MIKLMNDKLFKLTLFVASKTPAPPEAKLTPFRNTEQFVVVLPMEWYTGGVATPRLRAAMVEKNIISIIITEKKRHHEN